MKVHIPDILVLRRWPSLFVLQKINFTTGSQAVSIGKMDIPDENEDSPSPNQRQIPEGRGACATGKVKTLLFGLCSPPLPPPPAKSNDPLFHSFRMLVCTFDRRMRTLCWLLVVSKCFSPPQKKKKKKKKIGACHWN